MYIFDWIISLGPHSFFVPLTKYDNDVLFWDGWCPSETLLPPTSYKWFSKWFQLLGQSGGRVQSTIADTIAILQIHSEKFNICSCQGDSWWARAAPTKSAGWYFPISDISCERSAAGTRHLAHTFYFHTITVWLSHFECLYVPTVFVAQIFSDQSEIFFVVTLKYFFLEIIQNREPSLGTV